MNEKPQKKKEYRKRHLFARSLGDVVKNATQPLMNKQGKLYGALLRDWTQIVGAQRAAVTRPERLQFTTSTSQEATLHLAVRPAAAPELTYVTEQIIEQCARYFGYRAITRIVLHPTHGAFQTLPEPTPAAPALSPPAAPAMAELPSDLPPELRSILTRMAGHIGSGVVKKDETR